MGVRQYNLGKKHGLAGIRHMAHRKLPYDGRGAQQSYNQGYKDGYSQRLKNTGKTLDYSNPLNNQRKGDC